MKFNLLRKKLTSDPTDVFGHDPNNYDRARIQYPDGFIDGTLSLMDMPDHPSPRLRVIDIGAGTGMLGKQFLARGYDVTFVEPSKNSARFLQERFGGQQGVHIVNTLAHETFLPNAHADIIVTGDAAHWLEPEKNPILMPELRRLLKPGGKMALLTRMWAPDGEITKKAHELMLAHCPEYETSPTQLYRDLPNLRKRLGSHLVDSANKSWYGIGITVPYEKEELMAYFKSCSFSEPSIERDEAGFRKKVLDPLWESAKHIEGAMSADGKMIVPYEINGLIGSPKRFIASIKDSAAAALSR